MATIFDGENLLIILSAPTNGSLLVDVQADLYSDWKEWFKTGSNSKYPLAFTTAGGEAVTPSTFAAGYYFIQNQLGWRIRASEANQSISFINGNLVPADLNKPFIVSTLGAYTVLGLGVQPIAQTVNVGDGAWDVANGVDALTLREAMRLMVAALAGKVSGAPSGPIIIRDTSDTKNRITATVDANGNRTAVTKDVT